MTERFSRLIWIVSSVAVVAILAGGVFWSLAPGGTSRGPVPIIWDQEACAHCHMHIGEPAFAAQIQTYDGRVLDFDDPGCLFEYESAQHPEEKAVYFHHVSDDRFIADVEVAFVHKNPSPMGYGLAAVDRGAPGAISLAQAREEALSRKKSARGGDQ